jgi:asparagine synthase (glutamine-hydrolysing)
MCGIAGILLPASADRRRLAPVGAMAAVLRHRGPDGGGVWSDADAGLALGHRRLAIVDLSAAGRQPMHSHGERLVVAYNGEIYNSAAMRSELEAKGYRFRGHSDTEVMLAGFESFGIETSLQRMAGMFALGLWDRTNRVLHLVRDRMGKKPLYVALVEGALLFASELKAFRAFPGFEPEVDRRALAAVLRQGWVPDDQCIWQGVFKLPPGTMLSVGAGDLAAASIGSLQRRVRPWWSLAEAARSGQQAPSGLPAGELEHELDRLLRTVVRERMVADVPLGAFLSGGIDSALVASLMQAQSAQPVRTFTIGFDDARYDEAGAAAAVAQHLGTEHTEFRLTAADARAVIPDLPRTWDEPFADESQIPTLLVSRLARQHVTVALTGDGGDEGFGGYSRHFMSARIAPLFGLPLALRRAAGAALRTLPPDAWDAMLRSIGLASGVLSGGNLQKLGGVLGAADERELYQRFTTFGRTSAALGQAAAAMDAVPPLPDLAARLMYRDMTQYLPGDILVKLDRASMAVSLEARCPLLDHRVIEFAWRLPTAMKLRGGQGKWLLRQVLGRYVPNRLFERPKHGFNVPIGAWLKGPLRDWAGDLLAAGRLRREGLLDPVRVQACWREHLDGRRDHAGELWAILMVQAWLDIERSADRASFAPPALDGADRGARRLEGVDLT